MTYQFVLQNLSCLLPGLTPDMPVLRDYDHCSYFKYDAGKLLVGAFEPHARPWGADGIPDDFSFGEIAGDFGHFEPVLLDAMRRHRIGRIVFSSTCATYGIPERVPMTEETPQQPINPPR